MKLAATLGGRFAATHRDRQGRVLWTVTLQNGPTYEGLNAVLETVFRSRSQVPTWYMGVIDYSGFSDTSTADTALSHPFWSEYLGVSGGNRAAWSPAAAAAGRMDSSVNSSITISTAGSLKGLFLASAQAVGATSGVLYCTARAASPLALTAMGTLSVSYSLTFTPR